MVLGSMVPGMGCAVDLVLGALRVIVAMLPTAKGERQIVDAWMPLAGIVGGGWLSAHLAEAAVAQLAASSGDADFVATELATARHSTAHALVRAPALRDIVVAGADSTLALANEQL